MVTLTNCLSRLSTHRNKGLQAIETNKVLVLEADNQGNLRKRTRFDGALAVVDVGRRKIGKDNSTETGFFGAKGSSPSTSANRQTVAFARVRY